MSTSRETKNDINALFELSNDDDLNESNEWETWLGDTGASCHVTSNDHNMMNLMEGDNDRIIVGDKRKCDVQGKGDLMLRSKQNKYLIELKNVRVVPSIGKNIISIGALLKEGGIMEGTNETLMIHINNVTFCFEKKQSDGLYYIKLKRMSTQNEEYCNNLSNDNDDWKLVEERGKQSRKK